MRTDGQTDMTKLTVTFRNFANAPKNAQFFSYATVAFSEGHLPVLLRCFIVATGYVTPTSQLQTMEGRKEWSHN